MPKKESRELVSNTELQILNQLWDLSPQTIRELCDSIYGKNSSTYYATIQSLLDRLEKKGWVARDRSTFRHTFKPIKQRSDFIGQQIQSVANSICGGSVAALLGDLAKSSTLTKDEREELRKLIGGK